MTKPLNILFIEDDVIEGIKFNRVLSKSNINYCLAEVSNGQEALNYLQQNEALPDIIILDLNMPKLNGIGFLRILKDHVALKQIPAIIFTTSNNVKDIQECYTIGIAGYVIKPLKYEDYEEIVNRTIGYWAVNELV